MSERARRVSVVMATCNGESFLAAQLESILGQTRMPDEVVIVDDASDDGTVALLERYRGRANLRIEINPVRLGPNKNFEKALRLATGDLVFFSDQDDVWLPDKIETLSARDGGGALVYSDAEVIDESDRPLFQSEIVDYHRLRPASGSKHWYFVHGNCVSGHNAMITRALAKRAVPFPDCVMYDQWLALVASIVDRVDYVDRRLCRHRLHRRNANNNKRLLELTTGARPPRRSRKDRFIDRQARLQRLFAQVEAHGLQVPELPLIRAHFARLDERIFDFPLFFAMLRDPDHFFPGGRAFDNLDRALKLCQGARGYWLPGIKI